MNHVDNVEQVQIDLTSAGQYTIHVGRTGAGAVTQAFSLLISNENQVVGPELVKIIPNAGGELVAGGTLNVAPRELLFQFNENQDILDSTFGAIQLTGTKGPITYKMLPGDKANQVVMRFAQTLPDDSYQITIRGKAGQNPLTNTAGVPFNNGNNQTIRFELDLGAQVVSVVPQPVFRGPLRVTAAAITAADDGDTFTIGDGFNTVTFELNRYTDVDALGNPNVAAGNVAVNFDPELTTTAGAVASLVNNAINAAVARGLLDGDLIGSQLAGAAVDLTGRWASFAKGTSLFGAQTIKTLNQATDKVDVYFNDDDLDPASATNPAFYRLHNTATGEILVPRKVVYDPVGDKAQLIFSAPLSPSTYHLEIGPSDESNDSLATAVNVGTLYGNTTVASLEGFIGDAPAGPAEVDYYRIQAGASGTLEVTVTAGFTAEILDEGGIVWSGELVEGGTYYVRVSNAAGGSYQLGLKLDSDLAISNANSSYATATNLGILGAAEKAITGQTIDRGDASVLVQPGGLDEPGHRHILPEAHFSATGPNLGSGVMYYNFAANYGWNTPNQITEEQKQRTREIFEIYGNYIGVQFVETADSGIQVITGDLRAIVPDIPTGSVAGLGRPGLAIVNAAMDWGTSEYGGGWFKTAIHEIGHALSLGHAYDIPAIMGDRDDTTIEPVYPGNNDLVHLNFIWPAAWDDIDLYKFEVEEWGTLTLETVAERLAATSTLDTQLVLYREVNVEGTLVREIVAQNDDYYSNDSLIELDVEPGVYYVGVMSTGISQVDPTIEDSGFGGRSNGAYELKLAFQAEPASALVDATGTAFDGDADGLAGGTFDFWFKVGNNTLFVDKATGSAGGDGTLEAPYNEIDAALEDAQPGDVVPSSATALQAATAQLATVGDNMRLPGRLQQRRPSSPTASCCKCPET